MRFENLRVPGHGRATTRGTTTRPVTRSAAGPGGSAAPPVVRPARAWRSLRRPRAAVDSRTVRSRPGPAAVTILFLVLAVGLTFEGLLRRNDVPLFRDLLFFFLPYKYLLSEALRHRSLPLWNPWIFLGTPFLANLQTGVFYPLSVLLALPFPLGLNLFLLTHYAVASAGAYLFLRWRGLSLEATAIGTLTFVLGGYLVSMLNVTNHLQSAAWAPLLLHCWQRHLDGRSERALGTFALLLAVQLLGGSPESTAMTLLVIAGWTAYRLAPRRRETTRAAIFLALAAGAAIALAAFQILPTRELLQQSTRGEALPFGQVSFWSLEPVSLLQLLFPHSSSLVTPAEENSLGPVLEPFLPWIASLYLGLVPLCLAIAGTVAGREHRFWTLLAFAGIVLALGRHTPLLALLYRTMPAVFGKFRYPEKFYFFTHVAAMVLAAEGAERVLQGDRLAQRLCGTVATLFVAIGIGVWWLGENRAVDLLQLLAWLKGKDLPLLAYTGLATDWVFKAERLCWMLGAFVTVVVLWRFALLGRGIAGPLLVVLVAADLGATHHNLNLTISWPSLTEDRPLVDVDELRRTHQRVFNYQTVSNAQRPIAGLKEGEKIISNADDLRSVSVALWPTLAGNTAMTYGVGTLAGGDSIVRSSIASIQNVMEVVPRDKAIELLRIYGTGYLIGEAPLDFPSVELVHAAAPPSTYNVYRVKRPVPPARFVERLSVATSDKEAVNRMVQASGFDAGSEAVVEELPADWRDPPPGTRPGGAEVVRYDPEHVVIEARSQASSFLVLNDSYYPGWEARIDGVVTKIYRTNVLVRGVVVPAGAHRIEFAYRPASFRQGAWISLASLVLVVGWIVKGSPRRRTA